MGKSLLTLALAGTFTAALLAGCTSMDKQVIRSSPSRPATVTLIDTTTGKPVWSYDVPVGYKMIVDFDTDMWGVRKENPGEATTTEMAWKLLPSDAFAFAEDFPMSGGESSGVVPIDHPVRVQLTYRAKGASGAIVEDLPAEDTSIDNTSDDAAPTVAPAPADTPDEAQMEDDEANVEAARDIVEEVDQESEVAAEAADESMEEATDTTDEMK